MRLFVAVDPPADALEDLTRFLEPVRARHHDLRWSDPTLWHLTLTFCGEVEERVAERLQERLARAAARHSSFRLRTAGAGAFARPARAHAVWLGLDGKVAAMSALAASTNAAARRSGVPVEDRRFRGHLTVARCSPPGDVRSVVDQLASYRGPEWPVQELHLVRSHLGPKTVHERIASWSLAASYQA